MLRASLEILPRTSNRAHLMRHFRLALVLAAVSVAPAAAQTRMLRSPTVTEKHIAFSYANNIWIADRAGGAARRLTSFQGETQNPKFSPDGKWIAFSAEYGGDNDGDVRAPPPAGPAGHRGTPQRAAGGPPAPA